MDEHKEKEEDRSRSESAEEEDNSAGESMGRHHQKEYKEGRNVEQEPAAVQLKEVVETGKEEEEEASPSSSLFFGIFAHPCSLLRYLLRACAGWCCWGPLHGALDNRTKPQQGQVVTVAPPEAVAPANSTTEQGGGGGGEKAAGNYFYMQEEVVTRVWAVRRGRPPPPGAPGRPREGRGGNGGIHN